MLVCMHVWFVWLRALQTYVRTTNWQHANLVGKSMRQAMLVSLLLVCVAHNEFVSRVSFTKLIPFSVRISSHQQLGKSLLCFSQNLYFFILSQDTGNISTHSQPTSRGTWVRESAGNLRQVQGMCRNCSRPVQYRYFDICSRTWMDFEMEQFGHATHYICLLCDSF